MLEIDVDRMKNGLVVEERYTGGEGRGYPWTIVLDSAGGLLITSDGPDGNIGCPVTESEAAHFFKMLGDTHQHLGDEELGVLRAEQAEFARPILERQNQGR